MAGATVAALARTEPDDLEAAADALAGARRSRIHVFIATSAMHMARKLRLEPPEVLERVRTSVRTATEHADEVEFSAEDATRSEPAFLAEVCRQAIAAGATTVNLPDTVGYCLPDEHEAFLRRIQVLCPELRAPPSPSTATTTSGSRSRTRSPGSAPERPRSSAR